MKVLFFLFLLFFVSCASADFKIAWLSDTHVSNYTTGPENLKAVVRDINQQSDIAFAVVSGDITDTNTGNNLLWAKSILDSLTVPYYIIPGNHDTKWSDSGLENFRKLFKDDKFIFDFKGFTFIGLHQGPVLRMADGHFAPDDLVWLQKRLKQLNNPQQPIVFVTHYPIFPPHHVDNYLQFLKLIRNYNVKMLLAGHVHRNTRANAYGLPQVTARSILAKNGSPAYNIILCNNQNFTFLEKIVGNTQLTPWTKVDLRQSYQITDSLLVKPDFSVNRKFPQIHELWSIAFPSLITAAPNSDGRFVYIGDHAGRVHCLDRQNGKIYWTRSLPGALFSQITLSGNKLLMTCADSNVYCLNSTNGSKLWQFKTRAPLFSVPLVQKDTVFVAANDGNAYALNLNSGELIWKGEGIRGYTECKPLLTAGKLIFGAWDGTFYAFDERNGQLIWTWSKKSKNILFSPAACWPVALQEQLFVPTPDRYLNNIDLKTGQTNWASHRFKVRESIGSDGRMVFVKTMQDTLLALLPDRSALRLQWVNNLAFGYDFANSMIQLKDGCGFFGTKNGLVVCFDARNGHLLWQHKIGNSFIPTVLPISKNRVIVSSMDGLVVEITSVKP